MPETAKPKFVTVARILRPRGNKGEVAAELFTDFPGRLQTLREIFLADGKSAPRSIQLKSFWADRNHPGFGVFHFEGAASISDAEKLRGLEIQIPFEQRVALPAGKYFVTDLIGCSVFELPLVSPSVSSSPCSLSEAPTLLGRVRDVFFPGESQPGTPLLAVDTSSGELLVPLAEDICTRIDITARRIEVLLPEGLRDQDSVE
ncbi:MAG: 16S rRNA processing protein RimM [Acidobacteria bacterium]|nr:16S rRNA processing protein RimM [Acidobacteriota bacterium]MBS1864276.1 16S rRNA processing protein RimM [Acidobacteriota bacterium]